MTSAEKGTKGEQIAAALLTKHGIKFKRAEWGTGPDFVTDAGITIDAKYSSGKKITQKTKRKLYSQKAWRFNLHHHGIAQKVDFYIFILEDTNGALSTFVVPSAIANNKTFRISENQIKTKKYAYYENNFNQLVKPQIDEPQLETVDNGRFRMKAIINGKRFDTDKAILIGEGGVGSVKSGDFSHWEAGLYRTVISKQFFLAGEGGPMTRFGQTFADGMRGHGKKLIPLTREQALEWAEQYLSPEDVEVEFGDLVQDA